ncbi:hypothetical protein AB0E80_39785, partial [Streptomyces rimosus]|uniref:hypothetical protein n=1 Tax=Streptomyces rimosus TaxID=1927 RepID=UPI0033E11C4D
MVSAPDFGGGRRDRAAAGSGPAARPGKRPARPAVPGPGVEESIATFIIGEYTGLDLLGPLL